MESFIHQLIPSVQEHMFFQTLAAIDAAGAYVNRVYCDWDRYHLGHCIHRKNEDNAKSL